MRSAKVAECESYNMWGLQNVGIAEEGGCREWGLRIVMAMECEVYSVGVAECGGRRLWGWLSVEDALSGVWECGDHRV